MITTSATLSSNYHFFVLSYHHSWFRSGWGRKLTPGLGGTDKTNKNLFQRPMDPHANGPVVHRCLCSIQARGPRVFPCLQGAPRHTPRRFHPRRELPLRCVFASFY